MTAPSAAALARVGRYWSETSPGIVRDWREEGEARTLTEIGRLVWSCDPAGFAASLELLAGR